MQLFHEVPVLTRDHICTALKHASTDLIAIPVKDVKAGTYLVRVQVDGAESPLSMNQAEEYDSPLVTIL